jgi:hypothetical protein
MYFKSFHPLLGTFSPFPHGTVHCRLPALFSFRKWTFYIQIKNTLIILLSLMVKIFKGLTPILNTFI